MQHVHHFSLIRGFGSWLGYSARIEEKRYHSTFPRCVPGSWEGSTSRTSGRRRGSRSISISSAIPDILPIEICLNQASVIKSSLNQINPDVDSEFAIIKTGTAAGSSNVGCQNAAFLHIQGSAVVQVLVNLSAPRNSAKR